jgi:hypothetical protein
MASDKVLLIVSVLAVVISGFLIVATYTNLPAIGGIFFAPNQSVGYANVTIVESLSINFSRNTINWGSGYVDGATSNATLDSLGQHTGWVNKSSGVYGFPVNDGFVLTNIGNLDAALFMKTGKNATVFIGGTFDGGPQYLFNVTNCNLANCTYAQDQLDLLGACTPDASFTMGAFTDVPYSTAPDDGTRICSSLGHLPTANEVRVDLRIVIPKDAPIRSEGNLDTITATAERP